MYFCMLTRVVNCVTRYVDCDKRAKQRRGRLALDCHCICLQSLKLKLLQLHFCFHQHSVSSSVYNCHLFPEIAA